MIRRPRRRSSAASGSRIGVKRGAVVPKARAESSAGRPDYVLLGMLVLLSLFGLLMLYDASVVVAAAQHGNKYYFVASQSINLALGFVALLLAMRIDYHFWRRLAPLALLLGLVLLIAVFVPGLGVSVYGAKRWLDVKVTTLQPAYLLCFSLILFLSAWLEGRDERDWASLRTLGIFGALMGGIMLVVVGLQKDMGTGIILACVSGSIYFLSGAPLRDFLLMVPTALVGGIASIAFAAHRIDRIMTFFGGESDPLGRDYHINQVLIALGSGGLLGVGLGQSRQKYQYIPEVQTDSIFAIFGEEFGFFGSVVLISVFGYLLWRGMRIAMQAPDMFGRLLASGIISLIAVQMFVNLFAMTKIIPLTGVPLPFISNGGTSLIVLLFSMGIVLNISRHAEPRS